MSDDARALLEHVWALMGMPCGTYLVVMLELWLPLLAASGDLDRPFATEGARKELRAVSAATVDRYLKPARDRLRIKAITTTKPSPLNCGTRSRSGPALTRRRTKLESSRPTRWRTAGRR